MFLTYLEKVKPFANEVVLEDPIYQKTENPSEFGDRKPKDGG